MLKEEVLEVLKSIGIDASREDLEIPEKEEYGDVSFPCFKLAKKMKRDPKLLAIEIAKKIPVTKHPLLIKVEAINGYVNFFFYWEKIAEEILRKLVKMNKLDVLSEKKRIMVEYSQPNPVHSMHIGHARGTFIGDALSNLLSFTGNKVFRANLMNDMGLQVAKLVTGYLLWFKGKKPKEKPDYWLWKIYVKFHEEAKKNPDLEEKAREILRKYEIEKDKKIIKIWNKIVRWCVKGFEETYKNLGIKFDVYFYESDFRDFGKEVVYEALARGIAFRSEDGAIVAKLEEYGLPNIVILRSDGTGLYVTSDLGLTVKKFEQFNLDESVWVVSSQQTTYFKQLFKILELLGYEWCKNCYHCSFEHVNLPEGKMSSREGKAILLDEVIKKLIEKAYREVDKRNPKISKRKKMKIAKQIGIGALKYAILRISPNDQIVFDWNRMLSLQGNTGPYIQYAAVRCNSLLKRAKKFKYEYRTLKLDPAEKKLVKKLMEFETVVKKCAKELKIYYLANYLYELASEFNNFYNSEPVLNSKKRNFRLTLVKSIRNILEIGLKILGIEIPEFM